MIGYNTCSDKYERQIERRLNLLERMNDESIDSEKRQALQFA